MRFDEIFKILMDSRKTISRKAWLPCSELSYDVTNKQIVFFDGHSFQRWCPSHDDIVAMDWEVV
ncbi:Thoeris anti-defense Tad2 family protein [Inconstantimicrobium mannanitabidum]|uniref:Uncharacterized protein n=1 Tax=Inconstantimicrobium mannanitabidum TaxID=1604901 RepID=A0ACB5RAT3_9CLOT|nr:hypothetical protein [Clostridium sp. TW13]GKX66205.1 hypothetical protein rsdtw13_14630 [Clostridium sp. TW13]